VLNLRKIGTACATSTAPKKCKAVGASVMSAVAAGADVIREALVAAGVVDEVTREPHHGAEGAGHGAGESTEKKKMPRASRTGAVTSSWIWSRFFNNKLKREW